jgi:hypothetical protein
MGACLGRSVARPLSLSSWHWIDDGHFGSRGAAFESNVSNDSMQELEKLLTKLNPLAKEFIPPSHSDASSATLAASIPKQNSCRVTDACPFTYGCSWLLHDF